MQSVAIKYQPPQEQQPEVPALGENSISKSSSIDAVKLMLAQYQQYGFVILKQVFSAQEVEQFQNECTSLLQSPVVNPQNIRTPFRMNSGNFPERIDPVVDVSSTFERAVQDPRIIEPLRAIFNDAPLLFKDKLIFKLPGTEGYPMHQDYAWWGHLVSNPDKILTVTVAIDAAHIDNGGLELWSASHSNLVAEHRNMNKDEIATLNPANRNAISLSPGDVLIFHSLAPHQSGINNASVPRRSLYLTYSAESFGNLRENYYEYYKRRETADGPQGAFFR